VTLSKKDARRMREIHAAKMHLIEVQTWWYAQNLDGCGTISALIEMTRDMERKIELGIEL